MVVPVCAVVSLLVAVLVVDRLGIAPLVVTALNVLATLALLAVARVAGLSYRDVGLGRGYLRRGRRYAAVSVALVAAVYVVLLVLPSTREALVDARRQYDLAQALVVAVVVVPLRTVLLEEVAFRGVLWAIVRRRLGSSWATAVSSALFGVWHVLGALSFADSNRLVGERGVGPVVVVIGTVLVTGAAGVLLCELRRRSDSLLPPVALHWAANGFGVLAAALASGGS